MKKIFILLVIFLMGIVICGAETPLEKVIPVADFLLADVMQLYDISRQEKNSSEPFVALSNDILQACFYRQENKDEQTWVIDVAFYWVNLDLFEPIDLEPATMMYHIEGDTSNNMNNITLLEIILDGTIEEVFKNVMDPMSFYIYDRDNYPYMWRYGPNYEDITHIDGDFHENEGMGYLKYSGDFIGDYAAVLVRFTDTYDSRRFAIDNLSINDDEGVFSEIENYFTEEHEVEFDLSFRLSFLPNPMM